jgi:hypothetical protein
MRITRDAMTLPADSSPDREVSRPEADRSSAPVPEAAPDGYQGAARAKVVLAPPSAAEEAALAAFVELEESRQPSIPGVDTQELIRESIARMARLDLEAEHKTQVERSFRESERERRAGVQEQLLHGLTQAGLRG